MKHHPEQQDDEIYMGNQPTEKYWNSRYLVRSFHERKNDPRVKIGWKTWRAGNVAYDTSGNAIKDLEPVFVKRQEIESAIAASDNAETERLWQGMLDRGRIS